jgi:uncharacterized repeat protein (TIGR04076 family)
MLKSEISRQIEVKHSCSGTCKYYRTGKESFNLSTLGPPGLCLDLYSSAYPYCLALLYGAEFSWEKDKNAVNAQCPAPTKTVHFEVRRVPLEKAIMSNGIKKDKNILIRIIDLAESPGEYENGCACNHAPGQEFEFNQGDFLDQMCPAAFYNIYPTIKQVLSRGKLPWTRAGKVYARCPDNNPKITFEIKENEIQ